MLAISEVASSDTPHQQLTLPMFGTSSTSRQNPSPKRHHQIRETSREAYQSSLPRAGSKQARVLESLKKAGQTGATIWEVHERTGIMYSSVPSCTGALVGRGLVTRTDRTRETGNGGRGFVFVATEHADGGDR